MSGDSGNGAHLNYRIELANDAAATILVKRCLEALDFRFSDKIVVVDQKPCNAARVWKLYGATARKGDSTPERPHRRSRLIEVPEQVEVVPLESLERLAALAPPDEPRARAVIVSRAGLSTSTNSSRSTGSRSRGKDPGTAASATSCAICPWNSEHTNQSAFIIQFASGALGGRLSSQWLRRQGLARPA